ncbi:MAG: SET domain-containing protein-lysine N-methyltransferase, partial [Anaerolineales bacterium]|nr:SET domain-containing protein-lysine N-methyltransferase [Anaerolineales bacterium]
MVDQTGASMNRMTEYTKDYFNPKLAVEGSANQPGPQVIATQRITKDEVLAVFGGRIIHQTQLVKLSPDQVRTAIQVDNQYYLAALGKPGPAYAFTHRCTPNAGFHGQITLVAMKEITPGEAVCFDRAMFKSGLLESTPCACGSANCRGELSSQDWRKADLWEAYAGYFSPYIQRNIDRIRKGIQDLTASHLEPDRTDAPLRTHALSQKLTAGENLNKGHHGVYAIEAIEPGEMLALWGGSIVSFEELLKLEPLKQEHAIQVEENLHQAPFGEPEPADYFNHSCNPNAGLFGQNALVALRPISAGEEVCFDYAMSDSTPYDEFQCGCGEPNCRKKIAA